MKNNIININLESQTAPEIQEVRGKDYMEYGTKDWRNLYPQFLIDLYYNSSTHAAIINATSEMIAGEDIICEEEHSLDTFVKLKKFMAHVNGKESLHQIVRKLAFDFKLQGAYAIHIIWNNARTEIAELYHVPVERVRAGRPNKMGVIDTYYISADWGNTRMNKPYPIKSFNVNDRTNPSQLLYTGSYSPNMDIYHTPDYLAGCNWALVDQKVAEFHLNNISNGFSGSYFISFANGIPTQEERFEIERSLAEKFTGSESAGRFVLTFSEDRNRVPEITPIAVSNADKQYLALQELLVQNILTAHRVTSPMLMGIKNDTGLGSNVDELNASAEFYNNTVIRPYQKHILKTLSTILEVNNINLPLEFVQLKPITTKWTYEDMKEVMTQEEIREELGLKPLEEKEEVQEKEEFSKVGNIDGLPVYDTIEEAETKAKELGCEGYHEHELNGKTVYMPCSDHDQITNLDCNCKEEFITPNPCWPGYEAIGTKIKDGKEVPNCVPVKAKEIKRFSDKTALGQFIEDYGENIPEGWELIDEEDAGNEHEDFNFEDELNKIANKKLELASTGRANTNTRSEQDGLNKKQTAFYKVRYEYAENRSLTRKFPSREFCKLMMNANKLYRKEDVIRMNKLSVNPGWGPKGANTYNVWLFKGGANCHHYWKRRIFKTIPSEDDNVVYPSNIQSNISISTTKARSEGFTIKRNDSLVAKAPKTMVNNGFLN
tara:strand:- start:1988 stop:4138 length:2151 start_codon:yes stop_codon:yes gene_type:complete